MRQVIVGLFIGLMAWLMPFDASDATIYYEYGFESSTCDIEIPNGTTIGGLVWCTSNCGRTDGVVRCDANAREGSRYMEWHSTCASPIGDRCTPSVGETESWHDGGINVGDGSWGHSITANATLYFGSFVKFSRVSSRDIWLDTGSPNSWDKLIEFGGHASSDATRWGIGAGWPNSDYTATNGKFTFDSWCASSVITGACSPDHFIQNVSPYSSSTPYLADYDKWYALVLEVYMRSDTTGYMKLYVNGTLITHVTGLKTRNATGTLADIITQGTWGQTEYDLPEHYRYLDHFMLTDSSADMTTYGYMQDPEGAGSVFSSRFGGKFRLSNGRIR